MTGSGASPRHQWTRLVWLVILMFVVLFLGMSTRITATYEQARGQFIYRQREPRSSSDRTLSAASIAGPCSCYNTTADSQCCQRMVLRAHKFGFVLTNKLFEPFPDVYRRILALRELPPPKTNHVRDYRHVAIVRNLRDAMLSGYLYHKSGRECWLTAHGEVRGREQNLDWSLDLRYHSPTIRRGRSICTFLANETEEYGMEVYIDHALHKWYDGVMPYHNRAKIRAEKGLNNTLFVCFEDATNPETQEKVFLDMVNWLYPGKAPSYQVPESATRAEGHASSHDTELRARLRKLIVRLDEEMYNSTLRRMDSALGCGI